MSAATYHQIIGPLGAYYEATGMSHAVVLPANSQLVITAGQPGVNAEGRMLETVAEQIEAAFNNCDKALRAAGVTEGLWKAHKIQSWLIDVAHEPVMMEIWRKRFPGHRPTWACIGTSALCGQGMLVEIQAEAHIIPEKQHL